MLTGCAEEGDKSTHEYQCISQTESCQPQQQLVRPGSCTRRHASCWAILLLPLSVCAGPALPNYVLGLIAGELLLQVVLYSGE